MSSELTAASSDLVFTADLWCLKSWTVLASSAVHDGAFNAESEMKKGKEEGSLMLMHVHDCTLLSTSPAHLVSAVQKQGRITVHPSPWKQ